MNANINLTLGATGIITTFQRTMPLAKCLDLSHLIALNFFEMVSIHGCIEVLPLLRSPSVTYMWFRLRRSKFLYTRESICCFHYVSVWPCVIMLPWRKGWHGLWNEQGIVSTSRIHICWQPEACQNQWVLNMLAVEIIIDSDLTGHDWTNAAVACCPTVRLLWSRNYGLQHPEVWYRDYKARYLTVPIVSGPSWCRLKFGVSRLFFTQEQVT